MQLGIYAATGRQKAADGDHYLRLPVPANGEWQDVVVDFTTFGAAGRLNGLRLEMFTDTLRGAKGDSMEIASVKFYEDADAAYASLGMENPNRPQGGEQAPATTTEPLETPPEKGCRSSFSALAMLAALSLPLPLLRRRKRT